VIPSFLSGKNYSGQHPISFNIVALELQFESHDIFNQEGVWPTDPSSFLPAESANAISVIEKPTCRFLGITRQVRLAY
jgi:hypothetical protein